MRSGQRWTVLQQLLQHLLLPFPPSRRLPSPLSSMSTPTSMSTICQWSMSVLHRSSSLRQRWTSRAVHLTHGHTLLLLLSGQRACRQQLRPPGSVVKTEPVDTAPADMNQHSRHGGTNIEPQPHIKQEQMGEGEAGQHHPPPAAAAASERVQGAPRVKTETGASGANIRDGRGPEGASSVGHHQGEVVDLMADEEGDESGGGSKEYVNKILPMLSHAELVAALENQRAALKNQRAHAALEVVEEMTFDGRSLASLREMTVSDVVREFYDGNRKDSARVFHLKKWIDKRLSARAASIGIGISISISTLTIFPRLTPWPRVFL
ncbi:unnamed protein product [Vitrella brassicaformis CCMP3155]|uniref:Uncharacterized protein n=1 Tax=Vitrella brassicaformis (strain CCMP3155) TaxID=1169540 RepID=A0A0G4H5P7_VITBC|nr:unnamed protein product [Vitrella brassicaformis CCMP3155]|eukprot:CEM39157.1 unnamed protein product [Vitrella brassicaformis CCMP3155]